MSLPSPFSPGSFPGLDWVVFEPNAEPTWQTLRFSGLRSGASRGVCDHSHCQSDAIGKVEIRRRLPQWLTTHTEIAFALAIAMVTSLTIVAFLVITQQVGTRLFPPGASPWMRLIGPVAGSLVAGILLVKFFPDARGSGIPQTKAALVASQGFISFRTTAGKFLCCSLSLASGISLGREGPSVQIGSGIASVIARAAKLPPERVVNLVPVGAAAALAAAFNTPIAAVLFTLEEVLGNLHARVVGGVVIASAASWMVLHLLLGDEILFHVPAYELRHPLEFSLYAVLGVLGGLLSAAFVRALLLLRAWFQRLPRRTLAIQPAAGGLVAGLLALAVPEVLGVGYRGVNEALNGGLTWSLMLLYLLLKFPATVVCYSSGNPGGIFAPSLYLGAMLGGAIGAGAHAFWPDLTAPAGAYALVGMGTAFAGIVRSPMTSVIMIFELTRDYNIIVPLMISNLISYYIAGRLQPLPVYEALALQDGIHLPSAAERDKSAELNVGDVMRPVPELVSPSLPVEELKRKEPTETALVGDNFRLSGLLRRFSLWQANDRAEVGSVVDFRLDDTSSLTASHFPHVHPDHALEVVLRRLGEFDLDILPVVDRKNPRLVVGIVSLADLLIAYRLHKKS